MLRAAFRNFKYKRAVIAAEQFFLREFGIQANADSVAESGFEQAFRRAALIDCPCGKHAAAAYQARCKRKIRAKRVRCGKTVFVRFRRQENKP